MTSLTPELLRRAPRQMRQGRPPLLFVHGAWHGAWCWEAHFLPYFARRGWDSYAVSLRGHGASPGRERLRWASIADYTADLEQACAALPAPPVLIGHSLGGLVVQHALMRRPYPGAVLAASVPVHGVRRLLLRMLLRDPGAIVRGLGTLRLSPIVADERRARRLLLSRNAPAADSAALFGRLQDESFRAFLDGLLLALPRPERVRAHGTPVLVLAAEHDALFPVSEQRATARAYQASLVVAPEMAHDIMWDLHWDMAAARIAEWAEARFP